MHFQKLFLILPFSWHSLIYYLPCLFPPQLPICWTKSSISHHPAKRQQNKKEPPTEVDGSFSRVDGTGLEPVTSCTSSRCSTSWANRPYSVCAAISLIMISYRRAKSKPFFENSANFLMLGLPGMENQPPSAHFVNRLKAFPLPWTPVCGIIHWL